MPRTCHSHAARRIRRLVRHHLHHVVHPGVGRCHRATRRGHLGDGRDPRAWQSCRACISSCPTSRGSSATTRLVRAAIEAGRATFVRGSEGAQPADLVSWQPAPAAIGGTARPSQLSARIRARSIQSAGARRASASLRIFLLSLSSSGGRALKNFGPELASRCLADAPVARPAAARAAVAWRVRSASSHPSIIAAYGPITGQFLSYSRASVGISLSLLPHGTRGTLRGRCGQVDRAVQRGSSVHGRKNEPAASCYEPMSLRRDH